MILIKTASMLRSRFISESGLQVAKGVFGLACLACVAIASTPASADLVSPYGGETAPNFAELTVEKDHVRVVLEIDLNSYPLFVAPDDGSDASLAKRTGQTFVVEADGATLARKVRTIDVRRRIARQTAASKLVDTPPRSTDVVFVDIEFPFTGQPERITFTPPLNDDGLPLASIGMVAQHIGVPVTDYRYLSRAETMLPDWDDPWFTAFENPNLTRHHKSPLMSFLSMGPREVRHEIIFRLKDFEEWSALDLGEAQRLAPEQIVQIKSDAATFFRGKNPIIIDGEPMSPHDVQVARIKVGAEGLRILPDDAEATRKTMLLGVVLSYPIRSLASRVDMTWHLFPEGIEIIPITHSDPAGAVPSQIYRSDPTVIWNNHLTAWENPQTRPVIVNTSGLTKMPLTTLGLGMAALICATLAWRRVRISRLVLISLVGAFSAAATVTYPLKHSLPFFAQSQPDEIASHKIVEGLLTNISTAMLEPQNDQLTIALEPFVEAGNRNDVGAEMRRGLSVTLPSGAVARINGITNLNVESFLPGEYRDEHQVLANWTAQVSGGHWGHQHRQAVFYRGMFNISRHGDQWKLDGLTILTAKKEG